MLALKELGKFLSSEEITTLLREFEKWLKKRKKMSNYPRARADRDERKKMLEQIIKECPNPPTLKRIVEGIRIKRTEILQLKHEARDKQLKILQDIEEFFRELGIKDKEEVEAKAIGRVAPTLHTPITPTEFYFWIKDDENVHIEIGSLVTAHGPNGIKVTGLVSQIQVTSDVERILDSFYAHALGRPEEEMPTKLPSVMSAKVEVIRRSDGLTEPIRGTWPVTFATAEEIRDAYSAEISPEHEILAGFTYAQNGDPVPISIDSRYVLGYEAAHINISGASGVATKTSYALFLLYGLLAHSERHNGSVAAIAFNVKEADLMFIDRLPSWEELERWKNDPWLGPSIRLWFQAKERFGLDPIKWSSERKIKFFAPMHFHHKGGVLSHRKEDVEAFNYALGTLIKLGVGSLYTLFDPEDLDDKALAFIASMSEVAMEKNHSFDSLIFEVRKALSPKAKSKGDWFTFADTIHHKATAHKILNRMEHAIDNQLKGVILKSENTDRPIPIEKLRPNELWIIDITQLSDKGQRLVFQTVVRSVFKKLEERRSLELTGQLKGDLAEFPRHVVIFVDELNKFVPAGRQYSALKGEIVEMAARGRSIGMALIGAQQLASKVDEEVLANTSTFAVGRSHAVEIHKSPYGWLSKGLQEKAMMLEKGWMFLWHVLHKRPVLIHFPLPLHRIQEEIERYVAS